MLQNAPVKAGDDTTRAETILDAIKMVEDSPAADVRENVIRTQADRIRAMSDEELARLHSTATACHRCEIPDCDGGHLNCYDIWLDWLKSPVEVEG